MAPLSGSHVLVPKAVNAIRFAVSKTAALVRARLAQSGAEQSASIARAALARVAVPKQPLHPLAVLRQTRSSRSRFFSTAARHLSNLNKALNPPSVARALPTSATRTALSRTTLAPFSSPLRPNLTGGTLSRTAGGYSLGSGSAAGRRAFSHIPASQAQVVHNVSAGLRAFCMQGLRPRYDGVDPKTGRGRFVGVSETRDTAQRRVEKASAFAKGKGTSVVFNLAAAVPVVERDDTLAATAVQAEIAASFEAARKTLVAVQSDIARLSALGALPISTRENTISIRFPGCDGASVEALCAELGVTRGIVREDPGWKEGENEDVDVGMALLFPWAPGAQSCADAESEAGRYFYEAEPVVDQKAREGLEWESMMTASPASGATPDTPASEGSEVPVSIVDLSPIGETPVSLRSPTSLPLSDYESFDELHSDLASDDSFRLQPYGHTPVWAEMRPSASVDSRANEGAEGVWRFLEDLERARL